MSNIPLTQPIGPVIAIRDLSFRWRANQAPVLTLETLEIRPGR